jgi:hypothetical protein
MGNIKKKSEKPARTRIWSVWPDPGAGAADGKEKYRMGLHRGHAQTNQTRIKPGLIEMPGA